MQNEKKLERFKSLGENCVIDLRSSFYSFSLISIGNNVFIGSKAHFSAYLNIGNNVMFGPGVYILGGDHSFGVKGESVRFLKPDEIEDEIRINIEDEVWCGANVVILKGVTIGAGCVVGAGSVVSKELPPFTVCVGNPCKPIKRIFSDSEIMEHLNKLGYTEEISRKLIERRSKYLAVNELVDIGYFHCHKPKEVNL